MWADYVEEDVTAQAEAAAAADKTERVVNYIEVVVTDVQKNLIFAAQNVADGKGSFFTFFVFIPDGMKFFVACRL